MQDNDLDPPLDGPIPRIQLPEIGSYFDSENPPNIITSKTIAAGGEMFVIMNEDKSTVMQGPGGQPFHTTQKKIADAVCDEASKSAGKRFHVVPHAEAVKLVLANSKNW